MTRPIIKERHRETIFLNRIEIPVNRWAHNEKGHPSRCPLTHLQRLS